MQRSRKVGWGSNKGFRVRLFEAIEPVVCADCAREIGSGEIFTRGARGLRTTMPLCAECRPFSYESAPPRSPAVSVE